MECSHVSSCFEGVSGSVPPQKIINQCVEAANENARSRWRPRPCIESLPKAESFSDDYNFAREKRGLQPFLQGPQNPRCGLATSKPFAQTTFRPVTGYMRPETRRYPDVCLSTEKGLGAGVGHEREGLSESVFFFSLEKGADGTELKKGGG